MPCTTFSVFLDENNLPQARPPPSSSSRKIGRSHEASEPTTKENINPLTGLSFDAQPPLKRRKPSSSSALKTKSLPSSSKLSSKSKKHLSSTSEKVKGKKRAVLGTGGNRVAAALVCGGEDEAEKSRTALGARRAYEFTVMPLADITQAYDESEATRAATRTGHGVVKDTPIVEAALEAVIEENENLIEMRDDTSKEATSLLPAFTAMEA